MTDQHRVFLGSAKSLTEWYLQTDSSSEFAHTVELLLYLAESLGYDADGLEFLKSLQELKLPCCGIHDLRPIALFENLERLDLSDNYVENLSPLSRLQNLKWLNLRTNLITDVSPLRTLDKLEWLDLSDNLITHVASLSTLERLPYLNLMFNAVADLDALAYLSQLAIRTTEGLLISFEAWIDYYFNRPTGERPWYWQLDEYTDWLYGLSPTTIIHYLTRLFENADEILEPFSDAQVSQGLDYLFQGWGELALSNLRDEDIPLADRQRCVQSIFNLFQGCFAKRCAADAYQLNEGDGNPLDFICYWFQDYLSWMFTYVELREDIREVQEKIESLNFSYLSTYS